MTDSRNAPLKLSMRIEKLPLVQAFHITGYTFTECEMLVVDLDDGKVSGRGEGIGVYYRGDTPKTMLAQIEALREIIESGVTRHQLLYLLPAGGARNALDCALWDLEAKRKGQPVWQLLCMTAPKPLLTTFTLGADDPEIVADEARKLVDARAIKIKLTNDDRNAERVRAVPFPVGQEAWLDGLNSPIPIAADESVQDHEDLQQLEGRVQVINIKLDKCGGLTEALRLARTARQLGFDLMVGNMGGSSWSMAPAFVVGAMCSFVDLDGPIFISADRTPSVSYQDGYVWCPDSVWGGPAIAVV